MPPRDRTIVANRLHLHFLEWGDAGPTVLLLHGFLEHAHAWDLVGPRLAAAGYRVAALDWRGHGDSEWIGAGGYYHFADYTADLAGVVRALGGRVAVVGHSMGAAAALGWAGTEPDRAWAVVAVDALGPPDSDPADAPARFAAWLDDLRRVEERGDRATTRAEAERRLAERSPRFTADVLRHMVEHGTRAVAGGRAWKFDPLHQTRAPQPFYVAQARAFWARIACPVLYVEGAETPFRLPDADRDARLAALRARRVTLPGVGHHPHLESPEAFAALLADFLAHAAR